MIRRGATLDFSIFHIILFASTRTAFLKGRSKLEAAVATVYKVFGPLYDKGASPFREDGAVVAKPYALVLDGVSAPFSNDTPAQLFGGIPGKGLSGGEMVARIVETSLFTTSLVQPNASLKAALLAANQAIGRFQAEAGLDPQDSGSLAGATFAGIKVEEELIEVISGGDVFVLVEHHNGTVALSKNQVQGHDRAMNETINSFKAEVATELGTTPEEAQHDKPLWGKIIGEMWNRFRIPLVEARREDVNNPHGPRGGYALLNGQSRVEHIWATQILTRSTVKSILLFSDGLVPWEGVLKNRAHDEVGSWVLDNYRAGGGGEDGLQRLLDIARGIEKDTFKDGYTSNAEATAIAIEFD